MLASNKSTKVTDLTGKYVAIKKQGDRRQILFYSGRERKRFTINNLDISVTPLY